jgi:hypothetical protein
MLSTTMRFVNLPSPGITESRAALMLNCLVIQRRHTGPRRRRNVAACSLDRVDAPAPEAGRPSKPEQNIMPERCQAAEHAAPCIEIEQPGDFAHGQEGMLKRQYDAVYQQN